MLSVYEYLFYRFWKWSERTDGKGANTKFFACCSLTLVSMLNGAAIFLAFGLLAHTRLPDIPPDIGPELFGVIMSVALFAIHYGYFSIHHRYQRVLKKYGVESADAERRGFVWTGVYIVFSLFLLVALGIGGVYLRTQVYPAAVR